jgi:hypothetical protein
MALKSLGRRRIGSSFLPRRRDIGMASISRIQRWQGRGSRHAVGCRSCSVLAFAERAWLLPLG